MKGCIIGAPITGSGKTTVTIGLLSALRERGIPTQPFKVGPDFIDPGLHELAAGISSHNLDGWMLSRAMNERLFSLACARKDVAIVEGVMGLFDGIDGRSASGSTAEMAHWLDLPVVLVIDAYKMGRSVAAVPLGCRAFDPELKIAGVVLNRVAGEGHLRMLQDALGEMPVLAWLPFEPSIEIPERHLGLMIAAEYGMSQRISEIGRFFSKHLDVEGFVSMLPDIRVAPCAPDSRPAAKPKRVAIARDQAFSFYYHANRLELERNGAKIVEFSPLSDREMPDADVLYIGGGYPELHRRELEANETMRNSVRRFIESGGRFYAECGGLMYLSRSIEGARMVGLIDVDIEMTTSLVDFGYCEVTTQADSVLGPVGTVARGHQYHYSRARTTQTPNLYNVLRGESIQREGYLFPNGLASYVHLHFCSNSSLAESLLNA